jgi:hypothetical protein
LELISEPIPRALQTPLLALADWLATITVPPPTEAKLFSGLQYQKKLIEFYGEGADRTGKDSSCNWLYVEYRGTDRHCPSQILIFCIVCASFPQRFHKLSTGCPRFSTGLSEVFHKTTRMHRDLLISWGFPIDLQRTGLFSEFTLSNVTKMGFKPLFSRELIQTAKCMA